MSPSPLIDRAAAEARPVTALANLAARVSAHPLDVNAPDIQAAGDLFG